ncbi:MAG: hypothetical protein CL799_13710 [Chromatiales bacterium]|nr:hypothetical protein [Chromatiales bacterium]
MAKGGWLGTPDVHPKARAFVQMFLHHERRLQAPLDAQRARRTAKRRGKQQAQQQAQQQQCAARGGAAECVGEDASRGDADDDEDDADMEDAPGSGGAGSNGGASDGGSDGDGTAGEVGRVSSGGAGSGGAASSTGAGNDGGAGNGGAAASTGGDNGGPGSGGAAGSTGAGSSAGAVASAGGDHAFAEMDSEVTVHVLATMARALDTYSSQESLTTLLPIPLVPSVQLFVTAAAGKPGDSATSHAGAWNSSGLLRDVPVLHRLVEKLCRWPAVIDTVVIPYIEAVIGAWIQCVAACVSQLSPRRVVYVLM